MGRWDVQKDIWPCKRGSNRRPGGNRIMKGFRNCNPYKLLFIHSLVQSISHSVACLTKGPQPLPKRVVRTGRCIASFFNLQYPLISLRLCSSCLRLLPRLPSTSILTYIFPLLTCFRGQFLCNMWPIQFQLISSNLLQQHISKLSRYFWPTFWSVQDSAP